MDKTKMGREPVMNSVVQKALFPGILAGIISLVWLTNLIANPSLAFASNEPAAVEAAAENTSKSDANANGSCTLVNRYPESIRRWCGLVVKYAQASGLDASLVAAVMLQESGGNPDAYSKSGAVGLLQVMPRDGIAAGFQCANGPCFSSRPSMAELYDPEFNIRFGTQMLSGLINKNGSVREALRAYGPANVGYYYADKVMAIFQTYK